MRLWHESLIPYLPRQQLLSQHRECCALRGKGWGKKHATVNYVFDHDPMWLAAYHAKVMREMEIRFYIPDCKWFDPFYRGKNCEAYKSNDEMREIYDECFKRGIRACGISFTKMMIYPEHDDLYLEECLQKLKSKGVEIKFEK